MARRLEDFLSHQLASAPSCSIAWQNLAGLHASSLPSWGDLKKDSDHQNLTMKLRIFFHGRT